jgi:hypothetical protein
VGTLGGLVSCWGHLLFWVVGFSCQPNFSLSLLYYCCSMVHFLLLQATSICSCFVLFCFRTIEWDFWEIGQGPWASDSLNFWNRLPSLSLFEYFIYSPFFLFWSLNPCLHYLRWLIILNAIAFGVHSLLNLCLDIAPPTILELKHWEIVAQFSEIEMLAMPLWLMVVYFCHSFSICPHGSK